MTNIEQLALKVRQAEVNFIDALANFGVKSDECNSPRRLLLERHRELDMALASTFPGVCYNCLQHVKLVYFQGEWHHEVTPDNYVLCKGNEEFRAECGHTVRDKVDNMFDGLREDLLQDGTNLDGQ